MAPESLDVALGAMLIRLDKSERDLNETHTRLRDSHNRLDQLHLHSEDCRTRIHNLEDGLRKSIAHRAEIGQKVELLEAKLDDMRMNLTKVIEGQMDILNSNSSTREAFASVLATQDKQHAASMKKTRTAVYIGGGLLLLLSQVYAKSMGNSTLLDWLVSAAGIKP